MKTMVQITQEVIEQYKYDMSQPGAVGHLMNQATLQNQRIVQRLADDPALKALAVHYATALHLGIKSLPAQLHDTLIVVSFVQAIADWEKINEKFYAQLGPNPGMTENKS